MNSTTLMSILSWGLPPLLGAIIGFLTNAVAIRMLFRPLRPIHIFKLRLPLTPGVIPRQREQLAESIGNMVHKNLITVETLYDHLNTEKIKTGILQNISNLSGEVINKPVSELDKNQLQLFYSSLEDFLDHTLHKLFASENFRALLRRGIKSILNSLSAEKVESIVKKTNIKEILGSYVLPFLTGDKMKKLISREVNDWALKKMKDNTPLAEIIPEGFIKVFSNIFRSFLPDLLSALFKWLRSSEIRHLLETKGRELLKNILDKLNIMQKFFLSVAQYDKTLENSMPEILEDALNSFERGARDKDNQVTFIESVEGSIIKWEENGVFDLFYRENVDIHEKINILIDKIFDAISDQNAKNYITGVINDFLAANREKTVGDILEKDFKTDLSQVEEFAYEHVIRYLSDADSVNKLSPSIVKLIISLLNNMEDSSLARLFNLDAPAKNKIDNFILAKIYEVIEHKLPGIVQSFNIKALVVNKINSLNIEDVERLLMMVIEKHLKWINVFGALLGALIGFSQALMRLFY